MKRASMAALMSSSRETWGTPQPFFDWLDRLFAFTVDVCAVASNAKHPLFWSPRENGLAQSWAGHTAWCNFPYGRGIGQWLDKARDEAVQARALAVQLLPARVDTAWWRTYVMNGDGFAGKLLRSSYDTTAGVLWLRWEGLITGVHFHSERLVFEGLNDDGQPNEDSAPFPSALVIHAHPSRRPARQRLQVDDVPLTAGWPR